jgi:hypothetical protein
MIRSSATDVAASRRTISIMIGLRSIAVAAPLAGRPSLFYPCFLSRIRITACCRLLCVAAPICRTLLLGKSNAYA